MGLLARRRAARRRLLDVDLDEDPLALLVNFFDCALVLALAFLVAAERRSAAAAGGDPVTDRRERLERFRPTTARRTGPGQRLGVAYRLEDGQVVYVPEAAPR